MNRGESEYMYGDQMFPVLVTQLMNATATDLFREGCDSELEIHESWTIADAKIDPGRSMMAKYRAAMLGLATAMTFATTVISIGNTAWRYLSCTRSL